MALRDYIYREGRYRMLQQSDPARANMLLAEAESDVMAKWAQYMRLAANNPLPSGNGA